MRAMIPLASGLATALMLGGCYGAPEPPRAAAPTAVAGGRYQLDNEILAWCTQRKGLPATPSACTCLTDQLHVQRLPDDGARAFVQALYAVSPGSDPVLDALPSEHRTRLDRAAELCGTTVP